MKHVAHGFMGLRGLTGVAFLVLSLPLALSLFVVLGVAALGQSVPEPEQNSQRPQNAQASRPVAESQPAFRVTTRMVVVDVVARDKKDQTVNDLEAADFSLKENGKEQVISTFNFQHPGSAPATPEPGAPLPPHVFRNAPKFRSASALNVVLLDGLNSNLVEQAYVRVEMVKFLAKLPQGEPIAIYALGKKLYLLQDFTTDLDELKKTIEAFKGQSSHLLNNPTGTVEAPMTLTGVAAQTAQAMSPRFLDQINTFAQDSASDQMDFRVQHTMAALTMLARTLAGYPGRKNLIWITEAIPMNIFGDNGEIVIQNSGDGARPVRKIPNEMRPGREERDYATQLALAANLLADAQVAVYPVDARGLLGSAFYNVANQMSGASAMGGQAMHAEGRQAEELFQAHSNMEDIAQKTGGKASFNRNDIGDAVHGDIDDGSTYYTLGYYPNDKKWDGKFRNIQLTSKRPGVKLRYRLGYFALDRAAYMKKNARLQDLELDLALNPNSPVATALQFEAGVLPPSPETKDQVLLNYSIDPHAVRFERGSDSLEHAELDCGVRVFAAGKIDRPVKSEANRVTAALAPDAYRKIALSVFPCQLKIDLPPGEYLLRLAVRDNVTGLLGSVNAMVTVPAMAAQAAKPPEKSR
jgi:VWFA-related protein